MTTHSYMTVIRIVKMIRAQFSGICEPNPDGIMGYGCIIKESEFNFKAGGLIKDRYELKGIYVPKEKVRHTNHVAAYASLGHLLFWMNREGWNRKQIIIESDSQLVIKQLEGEWQIRKGDYKIIAQHIFELNGLFNRITYRWIPQKENQEAESLARKVVYEGQ